MTTYYYRRVKALCAEFASATDIVPDSFTYNGLGYDEAVFGFEAPLDEYEKTNLDTVLSDSGYTYHHSEET